jgi:hypothetical protein
MKSRYIAALILTVLLLVIARRTATRYSEEIDTKVDGITINHKTTTEYFIKDPNHPGAGPVVTLKSSETDRERAVVSYSEKVGGPYSLIEMTPENGVFSAHLPPRAIGQKWFYQINVYKDNIKLATIPPDREQFIKFKGIVAPYIIGPHILFMFATIFFGLMTVFTSIDLARGKGDLRKSVFFLLLTLVSSVLGGLAFGIEVTRQTFGEGWGGWPIGHDWTDTKTEILILFWLVTFFLSARGLFGRKITISEKAYSSLVIISFVVTFITFLIPHSI